MFRIRSTASSSTSQGRYAEVDITRKIVEFLYRWFPLSDQTRALVVKDLTCLVRDRGQALQLLLFVGISMAYLMLFKFASIGLSFDAIAAEQAWRAFLACMNFLFVGFILTAVMTRLVYPSVSLEGRAFWILLVAPIQLRNMIEAKYRCWLPFTISFAVMLLTTGSIALELPIESWLVSAVIGTLLALGCTGMATGLGALFASFEWESPNQVTAGLGTLVLFLCSLLMVVTLFVPVSLATALAASSEVRLALASYASRLPIFDGAASLVYNIAPGATLLICMAVSALITVGISWWARSSGSRALARQTFE
jgi:hypothetical protein